MIIYNYHNIQLWFNCCCICQLFYLLFYVLNWNINLKITTRFLVVDEGFQLVPTLHIHFVIKNLFIKWNKINCFFHSEPYFVLNLAAIIKPALKLAQEYWPFCSKLLFSLGLGRSNVLVLRFGPKMNTNVAVNTTHHHHHSKLFDQFQT